MALTRKFLTALGIDADKIDEIIAAHTETTNALKSERDQYKADADKLSEVQSQLDKANEEIKTFSSEDYKGKYESEKAAHDQLKSDIRTKEAKAKKENALKLLLDGFSEKGVAKILKYGGYTDGIELTEDGAIKGADELKKNIESEWGEYRNKTVIEGANPATPPKSSDTPGERHNTRAAEIAARMHAQQFGGESKSTQEG